MTGLVARGGFVVDIEWAGGELKEAVIRSTLGGECRVQADAPLTVASDGTAVEVSPCEGGAIAFATQAGQTYCLM